MFYSTCNLCDKLYIFYIAITTGDQMSLSIGSGSISLDGDGSGNINFISHAHSDHVRKLWMKVYSSKETAELIKAIYDKDVSLAEIENARMLDAGHILGSKQLYVENVEEGYSVVYTGDFQMEQSLAAPMIEVKKADVVIMDSTYPDPKISFDDKAQTIGEIQKFAAEGLEKGIVLLSSFALGKSQEVIAMLNDCGIAPVVSKKISKVNRVYRQNGIRLDYISIYEDQREFEEVTRSNFVGIVDSADMVSLKRKLSAAYGKQVYTATVTGLAKIFRFATDAQFAFSDHADFKQALQYIAEAQPEIVYTFGKDRELFAKNLRLFGVNAKTFEAYAEMQALRWRNVAEKKDATKGF